MANTEMIEKLLPENLRESAKTFDIDEKYLENETKLVVMVLESKSIDTQDEKQNWFNLMPLMNDEQLEKLRGILVKEKTKLKEIEEKYEKKKEEIKDKYLKKRDEDGYSEKVKAMKTKEESVAKQDAEQADDLLDMI